MTIEYVDAIAEMTSIVETWWDANAATTAGLTYTPEIRKMGVKVRENPDHSKYWARISFQTLSDRQASLTSPDRTRLFLTRGVFYMQLFGPTSIGNSFFVCQKLGYRVKKLFRKDSTNGITFSNARVLELEPEPSWTRANVVVEYSYNEVEG